MQPNIRTERGATERQESADPANLERHVSKKSGELSDHVLERRDRRAEAFAEHDGQLVVARCHGVAAGSSLNLLGQRDLLTYS